MARRIRGRGTHLLGGQKKGRKTAMKLPEARLVWRMPIPILKSVGKDQTVGGNQMRGPRAEPAKQRRNIRFSGGRENKTSAAENLQIQYKEANFLHKAPTEKK